MELLQILGLSLRDILNPQFYIEHGGLWMILFIVFAETGLFAGFFLPGDALLFVTGIYSSDIVSAALVNTNNQWVDLALLWIVITIAGIAGNYVGYWFGQKSGPFLYERKDSFFFKKKHLMQAHNFYEKNGGGAIIVARFVPFVRTFAPIVAGIVKMDKKKFAYYNIVGCMLWTGSMLIAGHFLQKLILREFHFNLKDHLEVIVIGIVAITTLPVLWKVFFTKGDRDHSSGFHLGGFLLGIFLGFIGILLAYVIGGDEGVKKNRARWAWIGLCVEILIILILVVSGVSIY